MLFLVPFPCMAAWGLGMRLYLLPVKSLNTKIVNANLFSHSKKKMAVRVLVLCTSLLLACLSKVEVTGLQRIRRNGGQYTCSYQDEPMNCINNPTIRIIKSDYFYYINVSVILTNHKLVECKHICNHCNRLLNQIGQGKNIIIIR